jgi:hypothetical protein
MNTNIGLIGLTLASFVLVPMMPVITGNSSQDASNIASWSSQVYSNLDGIHQDYDFQQFAPDLNGILNAVVDTYNDLATTANDYLNLLIEFATDPFNLSENEVINGALDLLALNKIFNNLTNAQAHWDSLDYATQTRYTLYVYPEMNIFIQWLYYSPTELNS